MKVKRISLNNSGKVLTILKGALYALIVSLLSILAFAFIIKLTNLNDGFIKPINQVIKILSVLFGCFMAFKKDNEKTLVEGAIIGGAYIIFAFILFSALNGKFEFSSSIFLDILFGFLIGIIPAIICNILRKSN